ncbi:heme ABC transporter ATP-binding protein [Gilvimarinus sp. DA14]|uniref:heme ABC transporter ATP-binding protein n=1 Tax=Gilvimarinus sp. DA14 TaxID=2956798 RepID=UPI0020B8E7B8|nr:heme ABC transporter ATP-binding protein [Gilvimarinus sp. DA14]UTF60096.1 heme ABC transporter ATP-binding protein [Gilvimarinus sp. DA14]
MSLLEVQQLRVSADDKLLLRDVDVSLSAGQVAAVIGPNGAGKTTLLKGICNDIPASGQVVFAGQPLLQWAAAERARKMAVLSQQNSLAFAFTGAEVVSLARGPHSTGASIDSQICIEAMAAMDVLHLSARLYPTLSGGEQQRLQLARVLAQIWRAEDAGERLLLLDEPVTSLDIGHQHQLMRAVREFAASGVAVLMTVHDITLAAAHCDHMLVLHEGKCVASGTPEQVVTEALLAEVFATDVRVIAHPDTGKPIVVAQ